MKNNSIIGYKVYQVPNGGVEGKIIADIGVGLCSVKWKDENKSTTIEEYGITILPTPLQEFTSIIYNFFSKYFQFSKKSLNIKMNIFTFLSIILLSITSGIILKLLIK